MLNTNKFVSLLILIGLTLGVVLAFIVFKFIKKDNRIFESESSSFTAEAKELNNEVNSKNVAIEDNNLLIQKNSKEDVSESIEMLFGGA